MMSLLRWDIELFRIIHLDHSRAWLDPFVRVVSNTGLGEVQIGALLLLCIFRITRTFGLWGIAAYAISGIIRNLIAHPLDRIRPSNFEWAMPLEPIYLAPAFPSGHASTSFAIAFMWWYMLRDTRHATLAWLAILWACAVGYSRIYVGVHFPLDVVGGAALGLASASGLHLLRMRRESGRSAPTQG